MAQIALKIQHLHLAALAFLCFPGTACKSGVDAIAKPDSGQESEATATLSLPAPATMRSTLTLALDGEPRRPETTMIASDATASFVKPAGLPQEALELIAEQDGVEQNVSLFYDSSKADYPIFTGDPGLIL